MYEVSTTLFLTIPHIFPSLSYTVTSTGHLTLINVLFFDGVVNNSNILSVHFLSPSEIIFFNTAFTSLALILLKTFFVYLLLSIFPIISDDKASAVASESTPNIERYCFVMSRIELLATACNCLQNAQTSAYAGRIVLESNF